MPICQVSGSILGMDLDFSIVLVLTLLLLLISFVASRKKTVKALKMSWKRLVKILPVVALMVLLMSIVFLFIPRESLSSYLHNDSIIAGAGMAALIGSISLIPGFIAFPLGGVLKDSGIPFTIISAFTTTLMMVGILTFPVERQFLGARVALVRNLIFLVIALCTAFVTGLVFGELG